MSQTIRMTVDTPPSSPPAESTLSFADGRLLRSGEPYRLMAGSMHYFRVHPGQWADRMSRLADLGVNAVDTYVAWNFHQRFEGAPRFDGWRDLERFLTIAADTGLDAVVRPGPYICAEWDNGGLPVWVTGRDGVRLRSTDPLFFDPVERWFDELVPRLAGLQAANGGPIVAVQVENEFGSYGHDQPYLNLVLNALKERGITELLYTADGPTERMQEAGSIPGVLATATLGSRPRAAIDLLRSRREGEPFVCAEFWNGWFDHWGEPHHVRSAHEAASVVADIVGADGSVSIYMAHGGTNFGLRAGANHDGTRLQPTVTSYDSDAAIAENGAITPKFSALRSAMWPEASESEQPAAPATLAARALEITRGGALLPALIGSSDPVQHASPLSFESLGLDAGLVLYETRVLLEHGENLLTADGVHDRAIVFVDGERAGLIESADGSVVLEGTGVPARLQILVENQGRINYGPLLGQGKGIVGDVRIDGALVAGWASHPIPLDLWSQECLAKARSVGSNGDTGFATAVLDIGEPRDAFLALPGFGKGFVWIDDTLLGRYWEIGPQRTLYVPAPMFTPGRTVITVLELDHFGERLELRDRANLGPEQVYVETFD